MPLTAAEKWRGSSFTQRKKMLTDAGFTSETASRYCLTYWLALPTAIRIQLDVKDSEEETDAHAS